MKLKVKLVLIVAVIALFASLATVLAANNQHSKMNQFRDDTNTDIVDPAAINGSSAKLTRGDGEVSIRVNTTGLPVGAYTNWWVIWNDTSECGGSAPLFCSAADLFTPSNSVIWAGGGVTNRNGGGHFGSTLQEGPIPGELFGPGLAVGGAQTSEIHYILRFHGTALSGADLVAQTTTFTGGCALVQPNNLCYDPQAVGFPAP